jgi:hypothetical protein
MKSTTFGKVVKIGIEDGCAGQIDMEVRERG